MSAYIMLIDCIVLISKQANINNKILFCSSVGSQPIGYHETEASGWLNITPKVWERAGNSVVVS